MSMGSTWIQSAISGEHSNILLVEVLLSDRTFTANALEVKCNAHLAFDSAKRKMERCVSSIRTSTGQQPDMAHVNGYEHWHTIVDCFLAIKDPQTCSLSVSKALMNSRRPLHARTGTYFGIHCSSAHR